MTVSDMRVRLVRGSILLAVLVVFLAPACAFAEAFIVRDGQPSAEIIVAENPQRSVRLAAHELQGYVEKITGAKLAIATQPSANVPVQLYVGRSEHTDRLKITPNDLRNGAYRLASGDNWLVFIGDDTDFVPIEPWARNNGDIRNGKLQSEWDKITGAQWGVPHGGMYKNRIRLPGEIGRPTGFAVTGKIEPLEIWGFDERGSFNAVCGFLRSLGVRWYMPGEVGEVVPAMKSIALPKIDQTVQPDFRVRRFNFRFGVVGRDTSMWMMRLGVRDPHDLQVAHGMATMTGRDEIFKAHPEWFALYGGKRHYRSDSSKNQLCYSNEELFQETVRYVRAQFDHYKNEAVSVMPPDGYTAICQCKLCEGKSTPEQGSRGLLSDHIWDFVNRVAKEVAKTHPDRKVLNCAYGIYTKPPLHIAKLEPNVLVCIVGGRRPVNNKPEQQEEFRKLREGWVAKTDNPILIFENYPFTDRGWYLPSFTPHSLGESVNDTKGISQGEDIWLSVRQDFDKVGIGFNHFNVYFTARMYWGGKQQDVDAMFREYCRLFYGPAEQEMHKFFTYCEANWQEMTKDKAKSDTALELFAAAKAKAPDDSIYGKRLALMDDFLKGLRNKSAQLGQKRGPVPKLRLVGTAKQKIVVDGKFDDDAWVNCPVAATGSFRELLTGRPPVFGTTVKAAWIGNDLCFAIRCEERPGEKLNIGATKNEDHAMWYGDLVEILLETESRSYYQIAVNPAGAITDADRSADRNSWFNWDSRAEVATHIADDHWTVEIRIPVTEDENDPLHQVIGRKPIQSLPWHINLCRQRIRENGAEYSAFSPTGAAAFHVPMKFAHFYDGRSHTFEADLTVTDYLIASRDAAQLLNKRQYAEAIDAFVALCEGKATDFQKSDALAQAALAARAMKDFARAGEIAARIPIEAVKKTVLMHNLLAQQKAAELIEQFGKEDIGAWPFWQAGEGWAIRGRAYLALRSGKEAQEDLLRAIEFTGDVRVRQSISLALGESRERLLNDDAGALEAYQAVFASSTQVGGSDGFYAVQGAARILSRSGKFDEALAVLQKANAEKLSGHWRGAIQLSQVETLEAAGRKGEAIALCKAIIENDTIERRHRQVAEAKLKTLEAQ